ncbi:Glycogenin-2, partial [Nowakowskiella sp. JEL0078]
MGLNAFVTLLTSDSYLPGALVLANALKSHSTTAKLVVLITPEKVSVPSVQLLYSTFDYVYFVPTILSKDLGNLELLGRPELDVTFTKFHVWGLDGMQQFERVVFLDADTVALRNVDELFTYLDNDVQFAAAADIGWPDCFNSGVFALRPSKLIYEALLEHAKKFGSFDGGDQGVLNSFFHGWSSGRPSSTPAGQLITTRLPFIFNVTPSASYSYLPAYVHYHANVAIVHFIGASKPWLWDRFTDGGIVPKGNVNGKTLELIYQWWKVFDDHRLEQSLKIVTTLSQAGWNIKRFRPGSEPEPIYLNPKDIANNITYHTPHSQHEKKSHQHDQAQYKVHIQHHKDISSETNNTDNQSSTEYKQFVPSGGQFNENNYQEHNHFQEYHIREQNNQENYQKYHQQQHHQEPPPKPHEIPNFVPHYIPSSENTVTKSNEQCFTTYQHNYSHPDSYLQETSHKFTDSRPKYDSGYVTPSAPSPDRKISSPMQAPSLGSYRVEWDSEELYGRKSRSKSTKNSSQEVDFESYRVDWNDEELFGIDKRASRGRSKSIQRKLSVEKDIGLYQVYGHHDDDDEEELVTFTRPRPQRSPRSRVPVKSPKSTPQLTFSRQKSVESLLALDEFERTYSSNSQIKETLSGLDVDEEIVEVEIKENGFTTKRKIIRKKSTGLKGSLDAELLILKQVKKTSSSYDDLEHEIIEEVDEYGFKTSIRVPKKKQIPSKEYANVTENNGFEITSTEEEPKISPNEHIYLTDEFTAESSISEDFEFVEDGVKISKEVPTKILNISYSSDKTAKDYSVSKEYEISKDSEKITFESSSTSEYEIIEEINEFGDKISKKFPRESIISVTDETSTENSSTSEFEIIEIVDKYGLKNLKKVPKKSNYAFVTEGTTNDASVNTEYKLIEETNESGVKILKKSTVSITDETSTESSLTLEYEIIEVIDEFGIKFLKKVPKSNLKIIDESKEYEIIEVVDEFVPKYSEGLDLIGNVSTTSSEGSYLKIEKTELSDFAEVEKFSTPLISTSASEYTVPEHLEVKEPQTYIQEETYYESEYNEINSNLTSEYLETSSSEEKILDENESQSYVQVKNYHENISSEIESIPTSEYAISTSASKVENVQVETYPENISTKVESILTSEYSISTSVSKVEHVEVKEPQAYVQVETYHEKVSTEVESIPTSEYSISTSDSKVENVEVKEPQVYVQVETYHESISTEVESIPTSEYSISTSNSKVENVVVKELQTYHENISSEIESIPTSEYAISTSASKVENVQVETYPENISTKVESIPTSEYSISTSDSKVELEPKEPQVYVQVETYHENISTEIESILTSEYSISTSDSKVEHVEVKEPQEYVQVETYHASISTEIESITASEYSIPVSSSEVKNIVVKEAQTHHESIPTEIESILTSEYSISTSVSKVELQAYQENVSTEVESIPKSEYSISTSDLKAEHVEVKEPQEYIQVEAYQENVSTEIESVPTPEYSISTSDSKVENVEVKEPQVYVQVETYHESISTEVESIPTSEYSISTSNSKVENIVVKEAQTYHESIPTEVESIPTSEYSISTSVSKVEHVEVKELQAYQENVSTEVEPILTSEYSISTSDLKVENVKVKEPQEYIQ